jgi:hypothetical protein
MHRDQTDRAEVVPTMKCLIEARGEMVTEDRAQAENE